MTEMKDAALIRECVAPTWNERNDDYREREPLRGPTAQRTRVFEPRFGRHRRSSSGCECVNWGVHVEFPGKSRAKRGSTSDPFLDFSAAFAHHEDQA